MVFKKYAQYYDLLYKDKDYSAESHYIVSLIEEFMPRTKKILEFGSGTGVHGRILADIGFIVTGIEKSHEMIQYGFQNASLSDVKNRFTCVHGDCTRTFIGNDFETVISLFHVLSYQVSNENVISMLKNAHRQISNGGIFIFDFWYAPAVWKIRPTVRVKKVHNKELIITRIAQPKCFEEVNRVDINYTTFIENLNDNSINKFEEFHKTRAFDLDEIKCFIKNIGFELLYSKEWMTGDNPSKDTWGVCSVLQKT